MKIAIIEDTQEDLIATKSAIQESIPDVQFEDFFMAELAVEADGNWDCIILDLWLPRTKGIDSFREVFAKYSEIPIIILTGRDDYDLALQAVREGAQSYIPKGVLSSKLLSLAIQFAIARNEILQAVKGSKL